MTVKYLRDYLMYVGRVCSALLPKSEVVMDGWKLEGHNP